MCFAMGNAIRLLKAKVNKFDINTPEDEAKEELLEWIDYLLHERIALAEFVIARNAAQSINEGDTILTYGWHRLVEKTLIRAKKSGKTFGVTIIDDPYERGGQELAKRLRQVGIEVLYSPNLGGLRPKVAAASNVFLGGEAIFANGSLNAPSGTADVAMAAMNAGTKVIVLCETINFDRERVSVDALTYNEIDPERNTADNFRLLFDNTHDKYITGVITEFESGGGNSPAQAILALLRKQEDPLIA
jgi:translation initiation factor eIF-2B subunit delta